jgi:DNA-binding NarL/FixJ family response regulator
MYTGMTRDPEGMRPEAGAVPQTHPVAPANAPAFTAMVVDDHPLIRESMAARLRAMGATEVVEAASAAEARARARTGPRDLAVIDIGLPDGSGIELVGYLRNEGWGRVVVLSAADDPYSVRAAFVAGAQGYLLKSATTAIVTDGVRQVLGGGVYADPSVASLLAAGLRAGGAADSGLAELSGREIEVLRLVADGKSNKEIGDDLGLSALTVKSHLARIARKLGTGDRAEMVALAMRAGVIR